MAAQTAFLPTTVAQAEFARMLSRVCAVLPGSSRGESGLGPKGDQGKPIGVMARMILLTSVESGLQLEGSSGVEGVRATIDMVGDLPSICVDGRQLLERVKALPQGPVVLAVDEKGLVIKSQSSKQRYRMPHMPPSDYPPVVVRAGEAESVFDLEAVHWRTLASRVSCAVCTDLASPQYGLCMDFDGDVLRLVASNNGHSIAYADHVIAESKDSKGQENIMVAPKALALFEQMAEDIGSMERIRTQMYPSRVIAESGERWSFWVQALTTRFPSQYKKMLPETNVGAMRFDQRQLITGLRNATIAQDAGKPYSDLMAEKFTLRISSKSEVGGESIDEVSYDDGFDNGVVFSEEDQGAERLRLTINTHLLLEAVRSFSDKEPVIVQQIQIEHAPWPVLFLRHEDGDSLVLIAPINAPKASKPAKPAGDARK